jgi:hypothetical protein
MTQEHPITPPPELIAKWASSMCGYYEAARWGADQELEACCHLLRQQGFDVVDDLRATRRPKPPTLKEQALKALNSASFQPGTDFRQIDPARSAIIRRALEQLDD